MRFGYSCLTVMAVALCLGLTSPAQAENEGQEDYSNAREKLLSVNSLADLSDAIELFETALNKGLTAEDAKDAKLMLTGALLRRAEFRAKLIGTEVPARWFHLGASKRATRGLCTIRSSTSPCGSWRCRRRRRRR